MNDSISPNCIKEGLLYFNEIPRVRRERIATAAMAALLGRTWKQALGREDYEQVSRLAVKHADALMKQLDATEPSV